MSFNWEIHVRDIITIVGILGFWLHSAYRFGKLELKLDLLWTWFQKEHNLNKEN